MFLGMKIEPEEGEMMFYPKRTAHIKGLPESVWNFWGTKRKPMTGPNEEAIVSQNEAREENRVKLHRVSWSG